MADTRTPEQRRRIMQSVGQKATKPEMALRRLLHGRGYRYRVNQRRLPGTPDLVFPRRRCVIFVHGCFWHGHGCAKGKAPKSRLDYWGPKIARNRERDRAVAESLEKQGWRVMTVWQCEVGETDALWKRTVEFLGPPKKAIDFRVAIG